MSNTPASKLSPASFVTAPVADDGAVADAFREWIDPLTAAPTRDDAIARLEALLLRASRFEIARRRATLPRAAAGLDRVARAATADALVQVLGRLDEYRGASRFSTWAAKFALRETATRLRELAWQERQADGLADRALSHTISRVLETVLTEEQQEVFTALSFSGMPIDVLADRLGTTRGAVYETLAEARRQIREHLADLS